MITYPARILLVDDNVDQLLLTEKAFARFGREVEVVSVKNGRECLDLLSRRDFSVVILDDSLPEMNGMEVIRQIKERGFEVPVIRETNKLRSKP